jgi:hypothetical protein
MAPLFTALTEARSITNAERLSPVPTAFLANFLRVSRPFWNPPSPSSLLHHRLEPGRSWRWTCARDRNSSRQGRGEETRRPTLDGGACSSLEVAAGWRYSRVGKPAVNFTNARLLSLCLQVSAPGLFSTSLSFSHIGAATKVQAARRRKERAGWWCYRSSLNAGRGRCILLPFSLSDCSLSYDIFANP